MGNLDQVPSFNPEWCARRESNPRPGFGIQWN